MVIVFDEATGKRITDHGTNSAFPDGNVPGLEPKPDEVLYRLNDDDPLVVRYLAGDIVNVTAVIENGEVVAINVPDRVQSVAEKRQLITEEYDSKIVAQREKIRQLQDEDKQALAITNAKTALKTLITERQTRIGAIV